jgi:hypothetical protein
LFLGLDHLSTVAIKSHSRVSAVWRTGQNKGKFVELVYVFTFVSLFGGTVLRITKTGSKGHCAISRARPSLFLWVLEEPYSAVRSQSRAVPTSGIHLGGVNMNPLDLLGSGPKLEKLSLISVPFT